MKSFKFIFSILFSLSCLFVNAQTTYKDVTLDRSHWDDKVVVVKNSNSYPVKILFEYKIGSRNAEWIQYLSGEFVEIPANKVKEFPMGNKIYALKLTYVDILKPTAADYIDAFVSGWQEGRKNQ